MKTFTQLMEQLVPVDAELLDEETVHLVPHGGKGTHFKVKKGIEGLETGEVIHDSHVDDLRDSGIKVKIHESDEQFDEQEQIDELDRSGTLTRYINKTKEDPARTEGRNLALKKKWGDKEYGLPEPKVKGSVAEEQIDELTEEQTRQPVPGSIEFARAKAKSISKEHGCVQHIDKHSDGRHSVSDWMSDKTIESYSNGKGHQGQD